MTFRIKSYHKSCHVIQQLYFGCVWIDLDSYGLHEHYERAEAKLEWLLERIRNYPKYSKPVKP